MFFVIFRTDNSILRLYDGSVILFETEDAARAWLSEGERIEPATDDMIGVRPIDDKRSFH